MEEDEDEDEEEEDEEDDEDEDEKMSISDFSNDEDFKQYRFYGPGHYQEDPLTYFENRLIDKSLKRHNYRHPFISQNLQDEKPKTENLNLPPVFI